jgi:hypothetical protein
MSNGKRHPMTEAARRIQSAEARRSGGQVNKNGAASDLQSRVDRTNNQALPKQAYTGAGQGSCTLSK